jgi:hypothetical protein
MDCPSTSVVFLAKLILLPMLACVRVGPRGAGEFTNFCTSMATSPCNVLYRMLTCKKCSDMSVFFKVNHRIPAATVSPAGAEQIDVYQGLPQELVAAISIFVTAEGGHASLDPTEQEPMIFSGHPSRAERPILVSDVLRFAQGEHYSQARPVVRLLTHVLGQLEAGGVPLPDYERVDPRYVGLITDLLTGVAGGAFTAESACARLRAYLSRLPSLEEMLPPYKVQGCDLDKCSSTSDVSVLMANSEREPRVKVSPSSSLTFF